VDTIRTNRRDRARWSPDESASTRVWPRFGFSESDYCLFSAFVIEMVALCQIHCLTKISRRETRAQATNIAFGNS
jgi:hypothetical protein